MSNDRIFLRCTRCLNCRLIYKHYPDENAYATVSSHEDTHGFLDDFISSHMDKCHPHRHGPDLEGFALFDCITENCWRKHE